MQPIWLIPLLPFLGFVLNGLGHKTIPGKTAGLIGSTTVLASFVLTAVAFFSFRESGGEAVTLTYFDWMNAGGLEIPFSFLIDQLSLQMMLIVTGVGFFIHLYSIGYMKDDPGMAKFFAYLNLFMFSMLMLVMGSNYILMFVGWEGVGLCSYLLIGFWFKDIKNSSAAKKAFVMNRIGDMGFLIGLFIMFLVFGSLEYDRVFALASEYQVGTAAIVAITICLFIGATGKSAQIPLFTWLPDAMAGPTPVSALIHAATMVTAGIYMVVRSNVLYALAPITMEIILIVGIATALLGAIVAMKQDDIKKVLAYSTVSQLGYMFIAVGLGAFSTAMFHLTAHAFFKALLFLGAGSVIHAMSDEQNIKNMGGLRKKLPITFITFLIGTLAISGFPFTAGFFSKDEILMLTMRHSVWLTILFGITYALTALYMFRLLYLTFYGNFRGSEIQKSHLHESPKTMTVPLIVLAGLSIFGGLLNLPEIFGGHHLLKTWLGNVAPDITALEGFANPHLIEWILLGVAFMVIVLAVLWVRKRFGGYQKIEMERKESFFPRLVGQKFYVDEIYATLIVAPVNLLSKGLYGIVEKGIDGVVNGVGKSVDFSAKNLRWAQTGKIGFYLFAMVIGMVVLMMFL